jgi:hypothetical protein
MADENDDLNTAAPAEGQEKEAGDGESSGASEDSGM